MSRIVYLALFFIMLTNKAEDIILLPLAIAQPFNAYVFYSLLTLE